MVASFVERFAGRAGSVTVLGLNDLTAPFASGSSLAPAALIAPCSGSSLGAIASGAARNLIHRCADVMLKERRRLVLMTRETPLGLIHIENMATVTRAGAVVLPAMPGLYTLPRTVEDMVDFMVGKALDHLGVPNELLARWGEGRGAMTSGTLPAADVRAMFDRIAPRYDLLNRTMTAGLDGRWRRAAAAAADLAAGDRAIDVCAGTGDLAFELAHRTTASGEVVGVDFSEEMVSRARAKAARHASHATFRVGDALALPFEDDRFDAATVAFGIRNVSDLDAGLAEMARVVRPGGRVRRARDHDPGAAAPLLRALVRPRRAAARAPAGPRRRRLLVPAGVGAPLPGAAGARGPHGRGRPRRRALAAARRRHRRAAPRARPVTSAVPIPAVVRPLVPVLELCEERLRERGRRPRQRGRAPGRRHARGRRQAGAAAAGVLRRPARGARGPRRCSRACCRPRRPSNWCTWRRSCTTTCWTARPCAAAGRRWRASSAPTAP